MAAILAIKNKNGEYKYFPVRKEVAQYVRQLETYINHPHTSKLREVYKDRFGKAEGHDLLKVIKDDLDAFERICKICCPEPPQPCDCAWKLRKEVLAQVIKDTERPFDLESPIEFEQELDFEEPKC